MGSGNLDTARNASKPPTSAPEDILAEAQRRIDERAAPERPSGPPPALAERLTRAVHRLARHWLAIFNTLAGLYIGGALLPPVLIKLGRTGIANALYAFYSLMCHQYPFRSWFLFGQRFAYPLTESIPVLEMNALRHFVGDPVTGYKMALCQRDIAIYGVIFLAGLGYALVRKKRDMRPWPLWAYFVFGIMPMMLDGGIQWISYLAWTPLHLIPQPFETIPLMRTLTGALFGFGVVATAYPYMNEYFADVAETVQRKLDNLSEERVSHTLGE